MITQVLNVDWEIAKIREEREKHLSAAELCTQCLIELQNYKTTQQQNNALSNNKY